MRNRRIVKSVKRGRSGQALVESALILLVFLTTLIGILDVSQLLFIHQSLVERTRAALRWGMVQPWDGTGAKIQNMVLYQSPTAPGGLEPPGFLGLRRANVLVTRTAGTANNPNDERISIAVVNFDYKFFTPFIARTFQNNSAVLQSTPLLYRN
ncbi:MAG: pilus assembly protein [Acidobacteriia bacterium]|nr:pilus assembly protein [Terriglobia bacterium]